MPATDYQGPSASFKNFGHSIMNIRREQVHSMETTYTSQELENFQRMVAEKFQSLSSVNSSELLSVPWILELLEVFITIQDEFNSVLFNNRAQLNKAPMEKLLSDFFDRSVKALDVCNAIRDGFELMKQWQKQLEIVLIALDSKKGLSEGQFRRTKKALVDLALCMLDDKESNSSISHRNRSFGRNNAQKERSMSHHRSLSWSVSRSWSAAKQLQAIGTNLAAPKPNETIATNGLSVAVYTMNYVLLFVMWALVAAIPCQDRGLQTHFYFSRQFIWAGPISSLHERIVEESKKRERRSSCGLLKEILEVEKCARSMNELTDSIVFPLAVEKEIEVRQRVHEVQVVYEAVKQGLDPMQRLVREVFHLIVRSRSDGLECIGRANTR
jgi:hypothetical protein